MQMMMREWRKNLKNYYAQTTDFRAGRFLRWSQVMRPAFVV